MRAKTTTAATTTTGPSTPNLPLRADEPAAVWVLRSDLHAWADNPRKNDGEPVAKVAASIKRFGFASPIIARTNGEVIAGHTRLKAAEVLGRKCYGIEISPQYCDVIVKRWENLTGKTATLEAS